MTRRSRVIAPAELSEGEIERWRALQRTDPALASPFLAPEFTRIVGRARRDVAVAILEQDGEKAGFFAFQRGRMRTGRAVGWGLSDHQGVVAAPPLRWTASELLRACGLRTFEFDHLVAAQGPFAPHHRCVRASPVIELSHGFDAYVTARQADGVSELRNTERKRRKLERERGAVTFEAHDADPATLATLLGWKSAQYARTGASDVLAAGWVREVVRAVHTADGAAFAGLLSVLRVDGQPAALHLGMRSESVWHWWFPTYDPSLSRYSPGLILLLEMAAAAPGLGLRVIDLGKGEARYKRSFANGALQVAEGVVETPSLAAAVTHVRRVARGAARRTGLGPRLRGVVRRR